MCWKAQLLRTSKRWKMRMEPQWRGSGLPSSPWSSKKLECTCCSLAGGSGTLPSSGGPQGCAAAKSDWEH